MQKVKNLGCISVLLLNTHVYAQDIFDLSIEQLMETKITVNAIEAKPLSLSPATISIITASDINRYGYKITEFSPLHFFRMQMLFQY